MPSALSKDYWPADEPAGGAANPGSGCCRPAPATVQSLDSNWAARPPRLSRFAAARAPSTFVPNKGLTAPLVDMTTPFPQSLSLVLASPLRSPAGLMGAASESSYLAAGRAGRMKRTFFVNNRELRPPLCPLAPPAQPLAWMSEWTIWGLLRPLNPGILGIVACGLEELGWESGAPGAGRAQCRSEDCCGHVSSWNICEPLTQGTWRGRTAAAASAHGVALGTSPGPKPAA